MKNLKRLLFLKVARKLSKNDNSIPVPTIISANTKVKGDIVCDGILQIDGHVQGDVSCSELVIGLKGSLTGGANVKDLHLYGTLRGKTVAENLFVSKTAKLIGDATHTSIAIEPGAYIDGHCMRANTATAKTTLKLSETKASQNEKDFSESKKSEETAKPDLVLVTKSTSRAKKAV